jgi:uncharacterized protein DUF4446
MSLSQTTLSILVLVALGAALLALVLVAPTVIARGRSRAKPSPEQRLQIAVEAHTKAIQRLEKAVHQLALGEKKLGELAEGAVRHVGIVRFDAFEDMGGRLSFAAAFLDGHGDGLVITSINGRQDTRCYAKQIRNGTSSGHHLSDEERQAIREALAAPPRSIEEAS